MPVFFQDRITQRDLRTNPRTIFGFGDNVARKGRGGLAAVCRGEPNAVGVVTKWWPGRHESDFFSDEEFEVCSKEIYQDLEKIELVLANGGTVVFPTAPLGSGLADLPARAPRLYGVLRYAVALFSQRYGGQPCPW